MNDKNENAHVHPASPGRAAAKVALIPGGVRGIGRALALRLGGEGWTVAACYRRSEDDAATLREDLGRLGVPAWIVRADVSTAVAAAALVREAEDRFGGIDALVNCVGAYRRVSLLEESPEGWNAMFDDNLHPVFYLCRAAAPGFIRRGRGRIVNFGMVNAGRLAAQPFVTAHYIAKAGVLVLTRSFAKLLAPHGVTVNSVSPGFIDSGGISQDELAQSFKQIPAGRMGTPQDAVAAVCWLLSEEARYVNGADIQVSGAWGV
ncbi:MAG: SDR family oxidoreductase [Acidobacteriota bacterium]|jgi:3-oxoacyl-[acyl-carrier protein] reductase|nr:SDR family oxidoreductase [Acidobacteriota bacterium]